MILPGSKATVADLAMLRAEGWDIDLAAHVRRGGRVLGLCGGYQMLGRRIADPHGIEGEPGVTEGLGLLDVETTLTGRKTLRAASGRLARSGEPFAGYEIHVGATSGAGTERPLLIFDDGRPDGAMSADGCIAGGYVHGLFDRGEARAALLAEFGAASAGGDHADQVDRALDELAEVLGQCLDIEAIAKIAGL